MPVLGAPSPVQGGSEAIGYTVPEGSLDRYYAARNNSPSQRCEIVYMGDSTTAPGASMKGKIASLREKFLDAGYPDGGAGMLTNGAGPLNYPPENLDPVASVTGWTQAHDGNIGYHGGAGQWQSVTSGDVITFQGKGTQIRLWVVKWTSDSAYGGVISYKVDNADPVTVDLAVGPNRTWQPILITGLTEGTHTVLVTNTGASAKYCAVGIEFLRATGVIIQTAAMGFTGTNNWNGKPVQSNTGLVQSTTDFWTQARDTTPGVRNPDLFILDHGINEQQGHTTQTDINDYLVRVGSMIRTAQGAGSDVLLVVPHLEYASSNTETPLYRAGLWSVARAYGCAVVDYNAALPNATVAAVNEYGIVHLTQAGYDLEVDLIWNVLGASV